MDSKTRKMLPATSLGSTVIERRSKPYHAIVKWHACPPEAPVPAYQGRWFEGATVVAGPKRRTAAEARRDVPHLLVTEEMTL